MTTITIIENIYIGFAVDMDRAYDTNSRDGRPLRIDHPKYLERCKHKKIFEDGMEKLFQYFKSIGAESAVTWFVNEASFLTTQKFPEILKKCVETGGEIGMHTHFNSSLFNSTQLTMPENPEVWEKEGIIEPKKRLEDFLKKIGATQKKVTVFKAGNHIRNKCMFEKLVKHGFKIDTTCVSNHKVVRKINGENVTLFDDTDIGIEPFKIETKNGYILEIPESRCGKASINDLYNSINLTKNKDLFIRLQIHPWEVFDHGEDGNRLDSWTNTINYIKNGMLKKIPRKFPVQNRYNIKLDTSNNVRTGFPKTMLQTFCPKFRCQECQREFQSRKMCRKHLHETGHLSDITDNDDPKKTRCLKDKICMIPQDVQQSNTTVFKNFFLWCKVPRISFNKLQYINCENMINISKEKYKFKKQNIKMNINLNTKTDKKKDINIILKNLEKNIISTYKDDFIKEDSSYYSRCITRGELFARDDDYFLITYINNNFKKITSCMELFAGIGNTAMGLYLLNFKNIGILEKVESRVKLAEKICKDQKINIKIISGDFFKNTNIFNYDLLFCNNAVASILDKNLDQQISIYETFLKSEKKKDIIMNAKKYGMLNVNFYKIIEKLKEKKFIVHKIITSSSCVFYRISNYTYNIIKFSDKFLEYRTINNDNTENKLILDSYNNIFNNYYSIKLIVKNKSIHSSFGVYFPTNFILDTKNINKLIFYARSENKCKLKVYTGKNWINIDQYLTNEYTKFEINEKFYFDSRSKYRIGIGKNEENEVTKNIIYILNPYFE